MAKDSASIRQQWWERRKGRRGITAPFQIRLAQKNRQVYYKMQHVSIKLHCYSFYIPSYSHLFKHIHPKVKHSFAFLFVIPCLYHQAEQTTLNNLCVGSRLTRSGLISVKNQSLIGNPFCEGKPGKITSDFKRVGKTVPLPTKDDMMKFASGKIEKTWQSFFFCFSVLFS